MRCLSTSGARSLDISAVARFPMAHSARPATKRLEDVRSFLSALVESMRTSASSDRRSIIPRYPILFSGKCGDAISFMHSSCPKCVGYPVWYRYGMNDNSIRYEFHVVLVSY